MGWFLSYRTSNLKIGHFGPTLAHKSGRIETRGPKFWHVVENTVVHLLESKSQDLWTGFWVIGHESWKSAIFGPILAHKSGQIEARGPKCGQVVENIVVHPFKIKISGSMDWILSYQTSKLKISHFGPILAHKSGQIETRGPKFGQVVENIVVHPLKSIISGSMDWFLSYQTSNLKIGHFCPIFGHESGRLETRGPLFLSMEKNIAIHLLKSIY